MLVNCVSKHLLTCEGALKVDSIKAKIVLAELYFQVIKTVEDFQ